MDNKETTILPATVSSRLGKALHSAKLALSSATSCASEVLRLSLSRCALQSVLRSAQQIRGARCTWAFRDGSQKTGQGARRGSLLHSSLLQDEHCLSLAVPAKALDVLWHWEEA